MIRIVTFVAVLFTSTAAHAEPGASKDWARVDDNMHTVFKVGNYALWGGLIGSVVGSVSGDPTISIVSQLATTGGTVARTSASLRQRRSIVERGVQVDGTWGYASWGLLGTGVVLGTAGAAYASNLEFDENGVPPSEAVGPLIGLSLGALAANIGGLVAASQQMRVNSRQRRKLGRSFAPSTDSTFAVRWTPTVDHEGRMGLGLSGTF